MKQLSYLALFCVVAFAACKNGGGSFKKGDKGLEYKIIADGSGNKVSYGSFIQMHIALSLKGARKDTTLSDSRDFMSSIQILDSVSTPPEYYKIISQLRKGDSVVIRRSVDSIFITQPMPPFMKKGDVLYTTVKMVNIFSTKEQADSAQKAELKLSKPRIYKKQLEAIEKDIEKNKAQLAIDDKIISDYLAKNNIKATKTKWGVYVAIQDPGTGAAIDQNSVVSVYYTGKTLDSSIVFDSNTDPKFGVGKPAYEVVMSQFNVVLGWFDGLQQLKNGGKAVFYIPSSLAYGKDGRAPLIKPNDNLVFDIHVSNVISEDEKMAQMEAEQKKMEEMQRLRADSIRKAMEANAPKK